jgi:hypothetical protein
MEFEFDAKTNMGKSLLLPKGNANTNPQCRSKHEPDKMKTLLNTLEKLGFRKLYHRTYSKGAPSEPGFVEVSIRSLSPLGKEVVYVEGRSSQGVWAKDKLSPSAASKIIRNACA